MLSALFATVLAAMLVLDQMQDSPLVADSSFPAGTADDPAAAGSAGVGEADMSVEGARLRPETSFATPALPRIGDMRPTEDGDVVVLKTEADFAGIGKILTGRGDDDLELHLGRNQDGLRIDPGLGEDEVSLSCAPGVAVTLVARQSTEVESDACDLRIEGGIQPSTGASRFEKV